MRCNQRLIVLLFMVSMLCFMGFLSNHSLCCVFGRGFSQVYIRKSDFHDQMDVDLMVLDDEHQDETEPKQGNVLTYKDVKLKTEKTCSSKPQLPHSLKELSKIQRSILLSHLIVNDQYKFIYCYTPKVACSNWKKVVKRLYGNLRDEDLIHMDHSHGFTYLSEFTDEEIELRLKTYFKFTFVRNPTERALSVYRNKFNDVEAFYRVYGSKIMSMFHKNTQTYEGKVPGDDVTFNDFLHYIATGIRAEEMNEHYMPLTTLCQPCVTKFDFIGVYDNIDKESEVVLRSIKAPNDVHFPVRQSWYKPTTDVFLSYYYSLVPPQLLKAFVHKFSLDFDMFSFPKPFFTPYNSKFRNHTFHLS